MLVAKTANIIKRGRQSRISTQRPTKQRLLSERAGVQQHWIRETTTEKKRRGGGRAYAKSLSQLLCDSRTLSNLSPSLHTHLPSCHYIVQANLDKEGRTEKRGRPKHEQREEKWGKERCDGLWDGVLAAGFLASHLSCLIAQGDSVTRWDWLVRRLIRRLQWWLAACCYTLVR